MILSKDLYDIADSIRSKCYLLDDMNLYKECSEPTLEFCLNLLEITIKNKNEMQKEHQRLHNFIKKYFKKHQSGV